MTARRPFTPTPHYVPGHAEFRPRTVFFKMPGRTTVPTARYRCRFTASAGARVDRPRGSHDSRPHPVLTGGWPARFPRRSRTGPRLRYSHPAQDPGHSLALASSIPLPISHFAPSWQTGFMSLPQRLGEIIQPRTQGSRRRRLQCLCPIVLSWTPSKPCTTGILPWGHCSRHAGVYPPAPGAC